MSRRLARRCALLAPVVLLAAASGCSFVLPHSNAGIEFFERAPDPVGPASSGAKVAGWIAGAPAVAALVPVAALSWATPWVDLADATDIATAPAVGLGYALQAFVGSVLYAAFFWLDDRPEEPGDPPPDPDVPWGFIVDRIPPEPAPRPPGPVPAAIDAYYAIPPGAAEALGEALDAAIANEGRCEPISVPIPAGMAARLELYLAAGGASAADPRPLVLMTPPSEGLFPSRWLARRYARAGVHAALIVPDEEVFLEPRLDAAGIEAKLRDAVVGARAAAVALAARSDVAGGRVLYLGVSAGGIFGAVLLGVEPAVARAALIFPGGDLPALVETSDERTVRAYRDAWASRGVGPAALGASFAAAIRTDPLRLARHVDPARLLLFLSAGDTSVPIAGGLALRAAAGGPETFVLAGDHETSGVCFGFVLRRADGFLLGTETAP